MNVVASGAPPRSVAAELSVYSAQLWGTDVSSFLKATVKAFPATTPRQGLSNPDALAPTGAVMVRSVPFSGSHAAADPVGLGWEVAAGEGGNARARGGPEGTGGTARVL